MDAYSPLIVVLLAIALLMLLNFLDKRAILKATRKKQWENVKITWAPFAPGWLFSTRERHYLVRYTDVDGIDRKNYCKVGMLTGIFWRDEHSKYFSEV